VAGLLISHDQTVVVRTGRLVGDGPPQPEHCAPSQSAEEAL